jgi:U4/U6.U5 tri-snRNP-associated protein 2
MTGFGKGDIFCLPDNYQVVDSSLTDIQTALAPDYSVDQISTLDSNKTLSTDVSGTTYLPGFIGMNNLHQTDFINTCVMALAQVPPIRDFFLRKRNYQKTESNLVIRFGDLISKIWSRGNYRNAVRNKNKMVPKNNKPCD